MGPFSVKGLCIYYVRDFGSDRVFPKGRRDTEALF